MEEDQGIKSLFDFQDKYSIHAQKEQQGFKKEAGVQGFFDSHTKSSLPAESEKQTPYINSPSSYLEQRREESSWNSPNNKRSYIPETNDESEPIVSKSKRFARDCSPIQGRGSVPFQKQLLSEENDSVFHDSFGKHSKSFLPATNERQSLEMRGSSRLEQQRLSPSLSDPYKKRPNLSGFKEDSDLSTGDHNFIWDKVASLVPTQQRSKRNEPELHHLFDVPTQRSMTAASEREHLNTNKSSYSEQARVESGWNKPYNIEANSFERNFDGNNQRCNVDTSEPRDLMEKSTSRNRNDQFYDQKDDSWRQERHQYAAESRCIANQEALSRNQSIDSTKETENKFSDGRTNLRDSFYAEFSDRRELSSRTETERNAFRLDGREFDQNEPSRKRLSAVASDWQESGSGTRVARSTHSYRDPNLNEPSRKRLSEVANNWQESGRSTHDSRRTHDREETNQQVFRQDLYTSERSCDRRSRGHDFSDDFARRSDSDYNRLREQDFSSSYNRRSDSREYRPEEQRMEDNTGLYNKHMSSESDRLWTRDIKKSYDQRF